MSEYVNSIYFGSDVAPTFSFDNDSILDITINTAVDVIGEELKIDTMEANVTIDDTDGTFRGQTYATPIWYYRNGEQRGKFYLKQITRVSREVYKVEAVSIIGLLDSQTFYGGYYTGDTLRTFLKTLLLSDNLAVYTGYYTKIKIQCETGNVGSTALLPTGTKIGTANVSNQVRAFDTATMQSKMKAKLTYKGLGLNYPSEWNQYTSYDAFLLGAGNGYDSSSQVLVADDKKLNYCLYVHYTRSNTSSAWPKYGKVYFHYGTTKINLGTPSVDTTYEIDVDPVAGTAIINGVSHSITYPNLSHLIPLHCFNGAANMGLYSSDTTKIYSGNHGRHYCNIDWDYYRIYSQDDEIQTDITIVQNYFDNSIVRVMDWGTMRTTAAISGLYELNDADYVTYTGDCPAFFTPNTQMLDLYNSADFDSGLDDLEIYGWIPICTKREALHQVLFSLGVVLKKTGDGTLLFTALKKIASGSFTNDDIYNDGTVEYPEHVNRVEVSEYTFAAGTKTTMFSTTDAQSGYYIAEFSEGIRYNDITGSDMRIIYYGWNAAVVKGTGTISGTPLSITERIISKTIADYPDGKTVTSKECKLITSRNSENILNKLASYYGDSRHVKNSLISSNERCGNYYNLLDPFEESVSGFLTSSSLTVSSVNKADCDFVVGFSPPNPGATYNNYVVLTGSGTWDVPEEVFDEESPKIHLVIIGAGNGGAGGAAGHDGESTMAGSSSTAAQGGQAGDPGLSGKILDVILEPPPQTISFSCGVGGTGGAGSTSTDTNNAGTSGTHTTVTAGGTTYTSEDGTRNNGGVANSITGDIYAKKPALTKWGTSVDTTLLNFTFNVGYGNGGKGGFVNYSGSQIYANYGGVSQQYFSGQGGGIADNGLNYPRSGSSITKGGGCSGGVGFGQSGSVGGNATSSKAGKGGNGGNAIFTPPKPTYGWGGYGGGGGGGGGSSGWTNTSGGRNSGGLGGYGGTGGEGGDGCVLVYY